MIVSKIFAYVKKMLYLCTRKGFMKELPTYTPDFEEYIRQGEPDKKERAQLWRTAIGLQQVDGLEVSDYLKELAKKNIEGEISIDEVQKLTKAYYISKTKREQNDDEKEEADKAAGNIRKILSTHTLDFSTNGYISLHRRIFNGVFKHAGQIRDYDFTKPEFVLRGGTVNYLNWEDLRIALDYEINREKQFDYRGLSSDELIEHIAQFVSGLWQIHAFREGNTRTTAVFTIQYLRSIGYEVNNELFASHSWYFRNALVRANYKNAVQGINYEPIYLERFFRNLLLGEQWELKSRYLVINPPAEYAEQSRKDVGNVTGNVTEKVTSVTENVIEKLTDRQRQIVKMVAQYPFMTTTLMAQNMKVSLMTIRRDIEKMSHVIRHVGPDKGGHWEIIKE